MSLMQQRAGDRPAADAQDFRLQVELAEGTGVIRVAGELDLATVPALRGAVSRAIKGGVRRLVIDLSAVTFIDSVGIGAVVRAKCRLGAGGELAVVVSPASYARVIFEVVGADAVLAVHATRAEALAALEE